MAAGGDPAAAENPVAGADAPAVLEGDLVAEGEGPEAATKPSPISEPKFLRL